MRCGKDWSRFVESAVATLVFAACCGGQVEREAVVVWRSPPAPRFAEATVSSDGRYLIMDGSESGFPRLSLAERSPSGSIAAPGARYRLLATARNAGVLLTVNQPWGKDSTIEIRRESTGELLDTVDVGAGVNAIDVDPSGRWCAVGMTGDLGMVDLSERRVKWRTPLGEFITKVSVSDDGRLVLASASSTGVTLVDGSGSVLWRQELAGTAWNVELAPDAGVGLASTSLLVAILDLADGSVRRTIDGAWSTALAASHDGRRFAMHGRGDGDGAIEVRGLPTGDIVASTACPWAYTGFTGWTPDETRLVVTGTSAEGPAFLAGYVWQIGVWSGDDLAPQGLVPGNVWGGAIDVSSGGGRVVTGGWDGIVNIWDASNGLCLHTRTERDFVLSVAFAPDGRRYALSRGWSLMQFGFGGLLVRDTETGELLAESDRLGTGASGVRFSPTGRYLLGYAADWSYGSLVIADGTTAQVFRQAYDVREGYADFLNDGLIGARMPDGVGIVSTETGTVVDSWPAPRRSCYSPARRSPDGGLFAVADCDVIRIWSTGSGALRREISGGGGNLVSLNWSPDARALACMCDDDSLRLFDAEGASEPIRLSLPLDEGDGSQRDAAFTPDGTRLAVITKNGSTMVVLNPLLCRGDCDGDGVATAADPACFQALWQARDPRGDFDLNGVYNVRDFTAFYADWARQRAGECP